MKWVTRERPRIDRLACSWLIARFIDREAEFLYVPPDRVANVAKEQSAIPYDVPGVELGHVGERCSFDAFLSKYGLGDPALQALAMIVRAADIGRPELAREAPGLLAIARGLTLRCADDHELLRHGMVLYDALYAWLGQREGGDVAAPGDAIVNEASKESFPASDPPAYTPLAHLGRPPGSDLGR